MIQLPKHIDKKRVAFLEAQALQCRQWIVEMLTQAKSSHLGCNLSIVDILVTLYHEILPTDLIKQQSPDRDFFILSKGHGASALYAALASANIISHDSLKNYHGNGTFLTGHPMRKPALGIEASTGSLGHGLSMGVGIALAAKHDRRLSHVYVLVGDGECQEGSIWEALMMAVRFKLNNLTVIVDANDLQGLDRTSDLVHRSWHSMFSAWGCTAMNIDGHDYAALTHALTTQTTETPKVIVAKTYKGKGIPFIQDKLEWHYKSFNPEQHTQARKELE